SSVKSMRGGGAIVRGRDCGFLSRAEGGQAARLLVLLLLVVLLVACQPNPADERAAAQALARGDAALSAQQWQAAIAAYGEVTRPRRCGTSAMPAGSAGRMPTTAARRCCAPWASASAPGRT